MSNLYKYKQLDRYKDGILYFIKHNSTFNQDCLLKSSNHKAITSNSRR